MGGTGQRAQDSRTLDHRLEEPSAAPERERGRGGKKNIPHGTLNTVCVYGAGGGWEGGEAGGGGGEGGGKDSVKVR